MKHILQFKIYRGDTHYIGEGLDVPVVTQGKTIDETAANIREAVDLYLAGEDLNDLGIAPNPSVLLNMELEAVYA